MRARRALFPQEPTEQRIKGIADPFRLLPEQVSAVLSGALAACNLKGSADGLAAAFSLQLLCPFSGYFLCKR